MYFGNRPNSPINNKKFKDLLRKSFKRYVWQPVRTHIKIGIKPSGRRENPWSFFVIVKQRKVLWLFQKGMHDWSLTVRWYISMNGWWFTCGRRVLERRQNCCTSHNNWQCNNRQYTRAPITHTIFSIKPTPAHHNTCKV